MTINLSLPQRESEIKPRITVIGVGGAGGNAVNNMISAALEGVEFIVANTDAQALGQSLADRRVQLGITITQGLGAGARPEVGRQAAEEALPEILQLLDGANMVFVTAGMGGGTGTGAAPVIAAAAREQGILTIGVVTKPFHFEGRRRMQSAEQGILELEKVVDTLIVIPNQNLFKIANEKTTFADAFKMADDVLHMGVRGVTDLMVMPGLINLDFADIRTVMGEMGKAMMGTGEAEGPDRSKAAAEKQLFHDMRRSLEQRLEEAEATYAQLLAIAPDCPYASGWLLHERLLACNWMDYSKLVTDIEAGVGRGELQSEPWPFLGWCSSVALQQRCAQAFMIERWPPPKGNVWTGQRYEHDRIRVAWVSDGFRNSAESQAMIDFFELHDRTRFETFGISLSDDDGSPMRDRMIAAFEHFVDRPLGRDRDHPLPAGTLEAKFRDCASLVLDAESVDTLLRLCGGLESVVDVANLLDVVAAGTTPSTIEPIVKHAYA